MGLFVVFLSGNCGYLFIICFDLRMNFCSQNLFSHLQEMIKCRVQHQLSVHKWSDRNILKRIFQCNNFLPRVYTWRDGSTLTTLPLSLVMEWAEDWCIYICKANVWACRRYRKGWRERERELFSVWSCRCRVSLDSSWPRVTSVDGPRYVLGDKQRGVFVRSTEVVVCLLLSCPTCSHHLVVAMPLLSLIELDVPCIPYLYLDVWCPG